MVEPLYQTTVHCPNCENKFATSRVRPSFKKPYRTDTDFCQHFKENNPDYYVVRVCLYCGFATTENFSTMLSDKQKKAFQAKVGAHWHSHDYGNERTWEDALATYKLALLTAQAVGEKDRVVAGLLHHIAWLYRYQDDKAKEERFLQHALDAYISVYEKEGVDLNNARLMFLIGDLHRRLRHYADSIKWFSRVINDKKIMDAGMIRACREAWATVREEMLAAKLELPEEMQQAK